MKPSFYLFMLLLLFCDLTTFTHSLSHSMHKRCHDDESRALLHFKESFMAIDACDDDPLSQPKLESWKLVEGGRGDCCSWDGVECDEETNHVINLDLSSSCLHGSINSNSTLFHLIHLRTLNLAYNNFSSSQIPPEVGRLGRLTHLNLSFSSFSGQIPVELSNLSSLVSLDLSTDSNLKLHNLGMGGLVQNLTNLKELHLSSVDISSTVPDLLAEFWSMESLQLDDCGLQGSFPIGIFHLPKLKMLNMDGNSNLQVYLPDFRPGSPLKSLKVSETKSVREIPSSVGNLHNLEELDFSFCNFTGQLPSSLGNLTKLTALDLSNNNFGLRTSLSWVGKLTKLTALDLHGINVNGNIPSELLNLTQLSFLDLGYCQLAGPIPSWLMNLTELSVMFLDHNQLIGQIPSWMIYGDNMQFLFLSSNQLSGRIPSVNNTLSQMQHLDLSSNQLQGSIPSSLFELKYLSFLQLHSNNLTGVVDLNMFFQLDSLQALSLSFNNLSLLTKISLNASIKSFVFLGLSSCNLSEFPRFLRSQDELQFLDLSSNNIHGEIPSWVWNISRNSLEFLNISHNFLTGFEQHAYPLFFNWAHLVVLDLKFNMLQGSLFTPPSSFHAQIPSSWRTGCKLRMINLSQNQIQGKVPRLLASCSQLELLDLSNNRFVDSFPSWLGTLPDLRVLILRSNGFYGVMEKKRQPSSTFPKLQIIDLSCNNLTGELPSMYFSIWNGMKVADASHISYMGKSQEFPVSAYYSNYDYSITMSNKGLEMEYLKIPNDLAAIDFSNNKFEGVIPNVIGNLKGLHLLNFSNNILNGHIPSSLANMKELECLDLSVNKFSGEIPPQLTQLTFLSSFNVSYNKLVGPIPQGNQFNTFEESSYEGNLALCGAPTKMKCGTVVVPPPPSFAKDGFSFHFGWKEVLLGYGSGFVIGGVGGHIFTTRKRGWLLRTFGRKRPRRQRRPRNSNRN